MELVENQVILHVFVNGREAVDFKDAAISCSINGKENDFQTFGEKLTDSFLFFQSEIESYEQSSQKWDVDFEASKKWFVDWTWKVQGSSNSARSTIVTTPDNNAVTETVALSESSGISVQFFAIFGYRLSPKPKDEKVVTMDDFRNLHCGHRPLLIGHRGMGNSGLFPGTTENSMKAFFEAASIGLDVIEFDLHLSSDDKVCVYHDFEFVDEQQMKMLVSENSLADLREASFDASLEDDEHHFPTFRDMLNMLPSQLGFNVELKAPRLFTNGCWNHDFLEADNIVQAHRRSGSDGHSLNNFIDRMLQELFELGENRLVYISTFSPEVAAMCRWKQHRYPVFFLSRGVTIDSDSQQEFWDPRTRSIGQALRWIQLQKLTGLVTSYEDNSFEAGGIPDQCAALGVEWMVWGPDLSKDEIARHMKKQHCSGIIFDDVVNVLQKLRTIVEQP